jgi:hypothetical protein
VLTGAYASSSSGSQSATASASSVSLAHLLIQGGSAGGKRKVRRLGSTQVVVSQPGTPDAAAAAGAGTSAGVVSLQPTAEHSFHAPVTTLLLEAPAGTAWRSPATVTGTLVLPALEPAQQPQRAALPDGTERQLADLRGGHFVSLHNLQRCCGDPSGKLDVPVSPGMCCITHGVALLSTCCCV